MTVKSLKIISLAVFSAGVLFSNSLFAADQKEVNNDKNVLMWVQTLDKNEINASKIALKRSKNKDVKDYAENMNADHSKNLKETNNLLKQMKGKAPKDESIKALQNQGKDDANKLRKANQKDFDKTYMGAMVDGHTNALKTLDNDISNLDSSSKITGHLKATRDSVSAHLDSAKKIQDSLK